MDQEDKVVHRIYQIFGQYLNGKYGQEPTFKPATQKAKQQQIGFAQFDSDIEFDLMEHAWKKGKKQADGSFAAGSLEKGWDFAKNLQGELNFKPETLDRLKQGSLVIERYEFTLSRNGSFVNVKRTKAK